MDPTQTDQSTAGKGDSAGQKGRTDIGADQLFAIPGALTGDAVYDMIMGAIEPDLVSTILPTLEEKYKNESPDERAARMARYAKAFVEYENQYAEYVKNVDGSFRQIKRTAMRDMEQEAGQVDQGKVAELESMFNTPTSR